MSVRFGQRCARFRDGLLIGPRDSGGDRPPRWPSPAAPRFHAREGALRQRQRLDGRRRLRRCRTRTTAPPYDITKDPVPVYSRSARPNESSPAANNRLVYYARDVKEGPSLPRSRGNLHEGASIPLGRGEIRRSDLGLGRGRGPGNAGLARESRGGGGGLLGRGLGRGLGYRNRMPARARARRWFANRRGQFGSGGDREATCKR